MFFGFLKYMYFMYVTYVGMHILAFALLLNK